MQDDRVTYQDGVGTTRALFSALPVPLRMIRGDVLNPNSLYRNGFFFCPTPHISLLFPSQVITYLTAVCRIAGLL